MRTSLATCLVCGFALALGAALGPLVAAKPTHQVQPTALTLVEAEPASDRSAEPPPAMAVSHSSSMTDVAVSPGPGQRAATAHAVLRLKASAVGPLADRCAPTEPAEALVAISRVESGFHPLRIRVNGARARSYDPTSVEEAVHLASSLIASGKSVDLGLAQVNNHNLSWLGLSIEGAFDPCQNLAAAGRVLAQGYRLALKNSPPGQSLLRTAYSLYNTGDPDRGITNGYADRVTAARLSP